MSLPIASHLPAIVELVREHPVVSVESPTGSGKSVAIPAALAAIGVRCFVTVPTRPAAISLANYQQFLAIPGVSVGYAAEGVVTYTNDTKIAYVTGGHARRKMLSYFHDGKINRPMDFCDVLMVDEVHSGSLDNTVILSLWLFAYRAGVTVPRLLIASATLVPLTMDPAPVPYVATVPSYEVEVVYLRDSEVPLDRTGAPMRLDIDDVSGPLYTLAAQKAFDVHTTTAIDTGHILVFAPGKAEVESIALALTERIGDDNSAIIIPAYSALKKEDVDRIYAEYGKDQRKIVIATNIAETSITISDIGHVIDTLAEKRPETSSNGGLRLVTHYISKDSADQRKGRTGRTRPGLCYRLCTAKTYAQLKQHRPAEIDRVPIYDVVIELLDVGLTPQNILLGVKPERIQPALDVLIALNMVTMVDGHPQVTDSGHFAPEFPLSVRNSAFLWSWLTYNGRHFKPNVIAEAAELGQDWSALEIDTTSLYSSLRPAQIPSVREIFLKNIGPILPQSIIDATANVGGDTIQFAHMFPEAFILALEIDPAIAHILRRNIEARARIVGDSVSDQVYAVNVSAVEYFQVGRYADMIYFDPPWGGPDYREQTALNLYLDGIPIGAMAGNLLARGCTPLVVLKLPLNADFAQIIADVDLPDVQEIRENVMVAGAPVYTLLFLRLPVPVAAVDIDETPLDVVPLTRPLPAFPGIVLASLIDAYGPSYFWIPRDSGVEYKQRYFERFRGVSDVETALNMWIALFAEVGGLKDRNRVRRWATENSCNNKKIQELLQIISLSVKAAARLRFTGTEPVFFDVASVIETARPMLLSAYSNLIFLRTRANTYVHLTTDQTYRLDTRDGINRLDTAPARGVIGLSTTEIPGQRGENRRIGFALDTDVDAAGRPLSRQLIVTATRVPAAARATRRETPVARSNVRDLLNRVDRVSVSGQLVQLLGPWIRNEDDAVVPYSAIASVSAGAIVAVWREHQAMFPYRHRYRHAEDVGVALQGAMDYVPSWQDREYAYAGSALHVPLRMTFQIPNTDYNSYLWLENDESTYYRIDWLPDYFIEASRMLCHRKGSPSSPAELWSQYGSYVENAVRAVLTGHKDLSLEHVREALYTDQRVKECTHEKITFLSSLLKLLGMEGARVFDGSAGWGDRMLASMITGASYYVGVDPNTNSQPGFQQMVTMLADGDFGRFAVLPLAMPDAELPAEAKDFDVVFLSPPSFDSEIYSSDAGQSVQLWAEERTWYLSFLFPTLRRCWSLLRPGGYFVLQSILVPTIAPFVEWAFPDAFFCGPVGVEVSNRVKPIWVWARTGEMTPAQQAESTARKSACRAWITRTYPELVGGVARAVPAPARRSPGQRNAQVTTNQEHLREAYALLARLG